MGPSERIGTVCFSHLEIAPHGQSRIENEARHLLVNAVLRRSAAFRVLTLGTVVAVSRALPPPSSTCLTRHSVQPAVMP